MDYSDLEFLGKGWAFPTAFDGETGSVEMVRELRDIKQSLFILMSTLPGERLMRPDYGCDLYAFVFENFNTTTKTRMRDVISSAILKFEPRVRVQDIEIKTDVMESIAYINIWYFVPKTNSRHNMVYPFYFHEGTNLEAKVDLLR